MSTIVLRPLVAEVIPKMQRFLFRFLGEKKYALYVEELYIILVKLIILVSQIGFVPMGITRAQYMFSVTNPKCRMN